jgi:5-methylthioadenosine/S-adenosylhomocysteine deaminase
MSTLAPKDRKRPILIKGGCVLTLDAAVGDFPQADVLVRGSVIAEIAPDIAHVDAEILDARGMIVMPGFVDSHRHLWQTLLRNALPNASLEEYFSVVSRKFGPVFTPDDVYAATLLSALGALDAGITCLLDWSSIQNTPDHTRAALDALDESGIRAVFAYGNPALGHPRFWEHSTHEYPHGIARLRRERFTSDDQLLTLALASIGGPADRVAGVWRPAREAGVRITIHAGAGTHNKGVIESLGRAGLMKSDTTYIHCCSLSPAEWELIRDTGGTVSLSPFVEMTMGMGESPIQTALDFGIRPSLSVDVETSAPGDMFTQMRIAFALQRGAVWQRRAVDKSSSPAPIAARDVIEFATIEGARANGLGDRIGTLTAGKQADIIALKADNLGVAPLNNTEGAVLASMQVGDVDTVLVAGGIVKQSGRLVGVDLERARRLAGEARERIFAAAGYPSSIVRIAAET